MLVFGIDNWQFDKFDKLGKEEHLDGTPGECLMH